MSVSRNTPRSLFWVLLPALVVLDQVTKVWVEKNFWPGKSVPIIPGFFNLTYVLNDGMAFGMFQGRNTLLFIVVSGIMAGMIWWSRTLDWNKAELNILASMILSGAIGNLVDRMRLGHVIDFADFYVGSAHWPAFNVADSCITVSVVWIVGRTLLGKGIFEPNIDPKTGQN